MREFLDGEFPFGADFTAVSRDALSGTAVLNGCSVSINGTGSLGTGGNALSIAAGDVIIDDASNAVASQNADIAAASSFLRYDLVTVDSTGTVNVATGSTAKVVPAIPAGEVVLAVIEVPSTASGVGDLTAYDSRAMFGHVGDASAHHPPIPSGLIAIWSGAITNIPTGWVICDGMNGTPNLLDRFVVGAGSTYAVDATGGVGTVTLTTTEMPSHNHGIQADSSSSLGKNSVQGGGFGTDTAVNNTQNAGGDGSHENKPPYYALAYMMKT